MSSLQALASCVSPVRLTFRAHCTPLQRLFLALYWNSGNRKLLLVPVQWLKARQIESRESATGDSSFTFTGQKSVTVQSSSFVSPSKSTWMAGHI